MHVIFNAYKGLSEDIVLDELFHAKTVLRGEEVPILQLDGQGLGTSKKLQGYTKIAYL